MVPSVEQALDEMPALPTNYPEAPKQKYRAQHTKR